MLDSFQQSFDVIAADSPDLRRACYRLRYQVYCVENPFEDAAAFAGGLETDEFDSHAVNALMVDRQTGDPIGTCRVVLPFDAVGARKLPLQTACDVPWVNDPDIWPLGRVGEVSRFCIAKAYRKGRMIGQAKLGLVKAAMRLCLDHRLTTFCSVLDPLLLRMLERLGLDCGAIGPTIEHHGQRQPCITGIKAFFAKVGQLRPDVWQIVTDNGELWEAACALDAQIGATRSATQPFRVTGGIDAAMSPLPLQHLGQQAMAAAS